MKKIISIILVIILALSIFAGCDGKNSREQTLRIYNWEDYIDPIVLDEFKEYYFDKYGISLNIQYETFDTNETMYTKIEKAKEDYDLVCPSEYVIEKMVKNDLVIQMDEKIVGEAYSKYVPEYIRNQFAKVTGNTQTQIYAVGYMWGTMGILYNKNKVSLAELEEKGWSILWDEKFSNKIFMKDSMRESYAVGNLYVFREEYLSLKEQFESGTLSYDGYNEKVQEIFNRTDEKSVALIEEALKEQKDLVNAMYDVDNDKNAMVSGSAFLDVCWSGDATWSIDESNTANNGVSLGYFIPYEGTNVWFDGWVIPKYAKNVQAANEFAAYLLRPDVAVKLTDYIGYTPVTCSQELLEYAEDMAFDDAESADVSYLFDGITDSIVNASTYPDRIVINAAAVMKDFGDANENISLMWSKVKGNTLPIYAVVTIIVAVLAIIFSEVWIHLKKRKKKATLVKEKRIYRPE